MHSSRPPHHQGSLFNGKHSCYSTSTQQGKGQWGCQMKSRTPVDSEVKSVVFYGSGGAECIPAPCSRMLGWVKY